jgi:hypothetical protein
LAQWVRRRLRSGIRLDGALLEAMVTTFGIADPEALLADCHSSEAASFLELLFYPDMLTKVAFERQWADRRLTRETEAAVLAELEKFPVTASIPVAGRRTPLSMQVPATAVAAFVRRLKVDWQPPPQLQEALDHLGDAPCLLPVRAMLRHARAAWHPSHLRLVARLLAKIPGDADDFEECLAFTLSLLPELGSREDPFTFLAAKKRFFFQSLCKAEAFERQRRASNMEILIMRGERAAHGSIAQWQRHMRRIDRISEALYGRTRFFHRPVTRG